jgi:UDP-N-acetylmuramate dehydrogenase
MTAAERAALEALVTDLSGRVVFDEPLAAHTTWKIGGPAEAMLFPSTREVVIRAVAVAASSGWPLRVMGNGSNLLCPDDGVRGLVINLTNSLAAHTFDGATLTAEAGCFLPKLARQAGMAGYSGLECVVGVPGTVGGGCVMNAGIPSGTLSEVLIDLDWLAHDGMVTRRPAAELEFGHRESALQHEQGIVLAARFALTEDEPAEILARLDEHLAYRRETQPLSEATCGSVFRRPAGAHPGAVIEQAGCKGMRVGDAEVSRQHANWILNRGHATAADVRNLIEAIRERVRQHTGIELVLEVIDWST